MAYNEGRGVAKDDAEAVKWYRKAAEQGLAAAHSNMSRAYFEGRASKDDVEAVKSIGRVPNRVTPAHRRT